MRLQNKVEPEIEQIMDHIKDNVGGSIIKRVRPTVDL